MATDATNSQASRSIDKLNSHFPYLHLSSADVEKYPDFTRLLAGLTSQITPDGISVQTKKDLNQAEAVLRHEKHSWLLSHILYHELQELLLDYEVKGQDVSLSSRDKQFHKIVQQCLTQVEIGDYLDFSPDPSSKVTTLGLTKEDLDRQNPYKKHLQSLQQALIPEVEERLRRKCENLVVAHDPYIASESTKLMFAKSSQLPALVEADRHRLEEEQQTLAEDQTKKDQQFWIYYQTLLDSLHLLQTLISRYKLRNQAEHDTITSEWLHAKCEALCLKIRLVELQILVETYTVETQKALKIIRRHLDEAVKDRDKEKLHRLQAIKAYKTAEEAGDGFDAIVAEFGTLKEDLENKQWAIAEFDKSQKGKS